MSESVGIQRTLSGSGRTACYFVHRRSYLCGKIRNKKDIKDLLEWSKEYFDEIITDFTEIDLNLRKEIKKLRKGEYDNKRRYMQGYISDVSRLTGNIFLYKSAKRYAEEAKRRYEDNERQARLAAMMPNASPELLAKLRVVQPAEPPVEPEYDTTEYTLPSGEKDRYNNLCVKAFHYEITDRDDLKALIEIAKSKGDRLDIISLTTIYWYDELAEAYMNNLLSSARYTDRALISRLKDRAFSKKDNAVLDRYEDERWLSFKGISPADVRAHKKWIKELKMFDD